MNWMLERSSRSIWLPCVLFIFLCILFVATKLYLDQKDAERRLALAHVVADQVSNGLEVFSADRKRALADLSRSWPSRHPNPTDWFHTHATSIKNVLPGIRDVWWVNKALEIQWSVLAEDRNALLGQPINQFGIDPVMLLAEGEASSFQHHVIPLSYLAVEIDKNDASLGFVVASFDTTSTLNVLLGELIGPQFNIMVKDGDNTLLSHGALLSDGTMVDRPVNFANQTWLLSIQSTMQKFTMGYIVFYVGITMSVLVCLFLFWQLRSDAKLSRSRTLYTAAGEAALDSIFVYEAIESGEGTATDFRLVDANKVASIRFKMRMKTPNDWLLSQHLKLVGLSELQSAFFDVLNSGKPFEYQHYNRSSVTRAKWLKVQVVKAGNGVAITIRDVTVRKLNQQQLQASEERFRRLVDGLNGHFIYSINPEGKIEYISSGVQDILGYHPDDFLQHAEKYVVKLPSNFADIRLTQRNGKKAEPYHVTYKAADNSLKMMKFTDSPVVDQQGNVIAIEGIGRDVTDDIAMQKKVYFQANHDQLTQLFNRYAFDRMLQQTIDEIGQSDCIATLCYIDMDKFKLVNDTCGHQAGDQLLRSVANILSQCLDTDDLLARVGGDEFCMILKGKSVNNAISTLESILENVAAFRFTWDGKVFHIGASIGVVEVTKQRISAVDLIKDADNACYTAKHNGRNQYYIHNENDRDLAKRTTELDWLLTIQKALENNAFRLYFQTIKALSDDSDSLRYEILLRLPAQDGSLISPGIFIPIAERYGLMPRLDEWVFEKTLALLESHPDHLNKLDKCAINLSGASLNSPQLLNSILLRLKDSSVPKHKLCFEITETSAVTNLVNASAVIEKIRDMGCKFALDDFGAGMSSFTYLKNMHVDYVKIDGSFVKDMANDKSDFATVKAIHDIAVSMGKETVAEFVGNEQTERLLEQIGVNYAQGFFISKPQDFADFLAD